MSATNLLLIEDDPKTRTVLQNGLTENGFTVRAAADGNDGADQALAGDHALIILDVMLPERDGWSILRELRQRSDATPVLLLTARDAVKDRVKGFDLGADDYLVKPFAFAELLARVRNLLRRSSPQTPQVIRVGDLEIDPARQRATRAGESLELTPKEFLLLTLLAQRTGEVLSRSTIARHVWDVRTDPDTNVVDVHIRRLRAKVDDPFAEKFIHTVRGAGYVLERREAD
jgi:two-component system copper resistance phosphate regulon response regulator CusR